MVTPTPQPLGGTLVDHLPLPCYVIDETRLERNLSLIADVARRGDVEIILALKAFAMWRAFPLFRPFVAHTTASSPYEARLSLDEFGALTHTYSPAYEDDSYDEILRCSCAVTFNSMSQFYAFRQRTQCYSASAEGHPVSMGIRVNPGYSEIETALYNPCAPGSRFGVTPDELPDELPEGIEGFHFHCLCENDSSTLEHVIAHFEARYARWLPQLKWLNMGGGHLMTRQGYDVERLVEILRGLHERYPHLRLIMEPGSAFLWQTGDLYASVVDVVANGGIKTAILNVSFTCHMPDCLEMPYHPAIAGAVTLPEAEASPGLAELPTVYRLGGNSCLSGDFMGLWRFQRPLHEGDTVVFLDMIHYTTVKTNMFNGIAHPSIALRHKDGSLRLLRRFSYEDYRARMC